MNRLDAVIRVTRGYGGIVHGNTATGEIDVQFPDAESATAFRSGSAEALEFASAKLRAGDTITDLDAPVVLTLKWNAPAPDAIETYPRWTGVHPQR